MCERPKRPLSSYMIFLSGQRERIKREHPEMKITEIAKLGGQMWRALEDKSKWHQEAAEAKDRYNILMREYEQNGGSMDAPVSRKRKMGTKQ